MIAFAEASRVNCNTASTVILKDRDEAAFVPNNSQTRLVVIPFIVCTAYPVLVPESRKRLAEF